MCPRAGSPQGGGGNVGEVAGYWDNIIPLADDVSIASQTSFSKVMDTPTLDVGTYLFESRFIVTANNVSEAKFVGAFPTGTVNVKRWGKETDSPKVTDIVTDLFYNYSASIVRSLVIFKGTFEISAGASVLEIRIGQITSDATPTVVHKGSTLMTRKVDD